MSRTRTLLIALVLLAPASAHSDEAQISRKIVAAFRAACEQLSSQPKDAVQLAKRFGKINADWGQGGVEFRPANRLFRQGIIRCSSNQGVPIAISLTLAQWVRFPVATLRAAIGDGEEIVPDRFDAPLRIAGHISTTQTSDACTVEATLNKLDDATTGNVRSVVIGHAP